MFQAKALRQAGCVLACACCVLPALRSAGAQGRESDAVDFLVMNVCVDAKDKPTLQNPLNTNSKAPKCEQQRNLRPGEMLPYYAMSWGEGSSQRRYSFVSSTAGTDQTGRKYPVVIDWTDHHAARKWTPGTDGVSLRTVMDGYASDIGSTGGETLSVNMGEGSANAAAKGIARFNKAWIFYPEKLLPVNGVNYGLYRENIEAFPREQFDASKLRANPELHTYFGVQARQKFAFGPKGQLVLDTLIGNKYSGRDNDGQSPGSSKAMERSYFTRELGDTRWEAWKRDDDPMANLEGRAAELYKLGRCGTPARVAMQSVDARFSLEEPKVLQTPKGPAFVQVVTNWNDKTHAVETHTWYMVHCSDWSDVRVQEPMNLNEVVEGPQNALLMELLSVLVAK